ncbi:MAG: TIGR04372 family glycosyltransferase [Elusimicrobia bacterium]|nr:TIGR04372 family glycosyltransferase [Elusimicrobiota bacterium]
MKAFHRFVNMVSEHGPFIFLSPSAYAIGNCSHEIQFGLIRARREGKKLVILFPFALPRKFRFPVANRDIFDLTSPYRADIPEPIQFLARAALTAVYGSFSALSLVLGKILGPAAHLPGRFTHPAIGLSALWKREEEPADFRWDVVEGFDWPEELQKPLEVGLRPEKRAQAHARRLEMGLPENAWFAGLHVREPGFSNPNEEDTCRNAAIANFIPAIREITSRGGWVVRLGDKSMTPLPPMERVIDYPHTRFKSGLLDLYLISECRLYIGMPTGILETARLFQRPTLITNMHNMTMCYPRHPGDRGIPKHVYSRSKGRFLSLREVIDGPWEVQHYQTIGDDFVLFENSPEELRESVAELLDSLDRGYQPLSPLQVAANRLRVENGRRLIQIPLIKDHYEDMHQRYCIAARIESSLGSISRRFVEQNWDKDSGAGIGTIPSASSAPAVRPAMIQ